MLDLLEYPQGASNGIQSTLKNHADLTAKRGKEQNTMKARYERIGESYTSTRKISASITDEYINIAEFDKHGNIDKDITIRREDFEYFIKLYNTIKGA